MKEEEIKMFDMVRDSSCHINEINLQKFHSKNRQKEILFARMMFCFYIKKIKNLRKKDKFSYSQITSYVGKGIFYNHSSAINAKKKCSNLLESNKYFKEKYEKFEKLIETLNLN